MPYLIAPIIRKDLPELWAEGSPYSTEKIYDLCSGKENSPPVNYDAHTLRPHSICHFDAPNHIIENGNNITETLAKNQRTFYGPVSVLRLNEKKFVPHPSVQKVLHWEVSLMDLQTALRNEDPSKIEKVFLTFEEAASDFYADRNFSFVLSLEAAQWLTSLPNFNLFGTVWRSADFQPGSRERPIHRELFKRGGGFALLD
jgi:kynurenine formamidase